MTQEIIKLVLDQNVELQLSMRYMHYVILYIDMKEFNVICLNLKNTIQLNSIDISVWQIQRTFIQQILVSMVLEMQNISMKVFVDMYIHLKKMVLQSYIDITINITKNNKTSNSLNILLSLNFTIEDKCRFRNSTSQFHYIP